MFSLNYNINAQVELLRSKYTGVGHADTNRHEWAINQHRDTYASIIGHATLLSYISVAENVSIGRKRAQLLDKMPRPCAKISHQKQRD